MTLLPDTRLAIITGLQASPLIPGDVTIAGATTDTLASIVATTGPYCAIYQPPGPPPLMWARWDRCTLNLQVWAATEATAFATARAIHDALHDLPGTTTSGTVVMQVTDQTSPGTLHDPGLPDLHRVTWTIQVKARNAA